MATENDHRSRKEYMATGADWLPFRSVANHGPAPYKRGGGGGRAEVLDEICRPPKLSTGPRRAGGRWVKVASIDHHTGPQSCFTDRPLWHCLIGCNASPRLHGDGHKKKMWPFGVCPNCAWAILRLQILYIVIYVQISMWTANMRDSRIESFARQFEHNFFVFYFYFVVGLVGIPINYS